MFEPRATFTAPLSRARVSTREIACVSARGFTLVELLITLTIIAILASVAIPSYRSHVIRSHRSEAEQLMTNIANREAQYLLDARDYTNQIGSAGLNITVDGWTCTAACVSSEYKVTVALGDSLSDGFTITADPIGSQTRDGTLTLTSSGSKARMVSGVDKGW